MPYFEDMTVDPLSGSIRVGWLSAEHPFPTGSVDSTFVKRLGLLYVRRVRQTRGFHACPFCGERQFGLAVEIKGESIRLGSAEIEVFDAEGRRFAAPDLIYHYIKSHSYLPPNEFIRAVCP
jgi:hypothetical protein